MPLPPVPVRKGETPQRLAIGKMTADSMPTLCWCGPPRGPICHRGTRTASSHLGQIRPGWSWVAGAVLESRRGADRRTSYTARLDLAGIERISQNLGEEGVETGPSLRYPPQWLRRSRRSAQSVDRRSVDLLYHLCCPLLLASGIIDPSEVERAVAGATVWSGRRTCRGTRTSSCPLEYAFHLSMPPSTHRFAPAPPCLPHVPRFLADILTPLAVYRRCPLSLPIASCARRTGGDESSPASSCFLGSPRG